MQHAVSARAPAHLLIVAILAILWNAFGCYDYLMTMTENEDYLAQFPAEAVSYWQGLPSWLTAFWALGVWAGLAGALALLLRSRFAIWAFALSLIGAVIGLGYQKAMTDMPASLEDGMMGIMPWVVIGLAALQLWYSWNAEKKGWLR